MITAIIIDDEQHCISRLDSLVQQYFAQELTIVARCQTISEAITAITTLKPKLIFLDVQIHDETGFDLLKQLPAINSAVVFTTAFEKYAVQAFKFSAVDYLLKPVDADDMRAAISKVTSSLSTKNAAAKLNMLLQNIQQADVYTQRICIPVSTGVIFLPVGDILHCESQVNYTTLHLKDKRKIVAAKTLKEFEDMLTDYHFFRVHNSHLVNMAYISSYNKGKAGGYIKMTDGTELEVSTRRKDEFLKRMQ